MRMGTYSKAWGSLIGSAVAIAALYGLVPEETPAQVDSTLNALLPIIGGFIGTWIAPKNKY